MNDTNDVNVMKNDDEKEKKYKRNKKIILLVAIGLIVIRVLTTFLTISFTLRLIEKKYNNVIEELKDMDDGESHNIKQMYEFIELASICMNVDEFYDSSIIKDIEYLDGKWEIENVELNGKTYSSISECEMKFSKGRLLQTTNMYIAESEYDWSISYKDGIFYCDLADSVEGNGMITEYDGVGDDSMVIKETFGELGEWVYYCEKVAE